MCTKKMIKYKMSIYYTLNYVQLNYKLYIFFHRSIIIFNFNNITQND